MSKSKAFVLPSEWKRAGDGTARLDPHANYLTEAQVRRHREIAKGPRPLGLVKGHGSWTPRMRRPKPAPAPVPDPAPTTHEAAALLDVTAEMVRTYDRQVSTDPVRRVAVVVEEAGEALKEVLDATRRPHEYGAATAQQQMMRCRAELVQCASAAVRVIAQIDWEDKQRMSHKPVRSKSGKK